MGDDQGLETQGRRVQEEHEQLMAKLSTLREALLGIIEECDRPGIGDSLLRIKSIALSALEDEATVERPNLQGL
ncbi:MAG: hypothetical protein H0T12_00685 [Actinobacteria bacterium]|nr:hypothetical protein [Actinomycetota bacterium]